MEPQWGAAGDGGNACNGIGSGALLAPAPAVVAPATDVDVCNAGDGGNGGPGAGIGGHAVSSGGIGVATTGGSATGGAAAGIGGAGGDGGDACNRRDGTLIATAPAVVSPIAATDVDI